MSTQWKLNSKYNGYLASSYWEGELQNCMCSYPYIAYRGVAYTCLTNDDWREIIFCPNCNSVIVEEEELTSQDEVSICAGCIYFHGEDDVICALHPEGQEDYCEDWESDTIPAGTAKRYEDGCQGHRY
jgi:hypothetical protein